MKTTHFINFHLSAETLKTLIKQHYDRINKLEDQKYDLEYVVKRKDVEVHTYKNTLFYYFFRFEKSKSANTKFISST